MDKFVVGGLVVAILIAIMAPYLASSDPDGLESAAEKIINPEVSDEAFLESPMPDYVIPSLGEDPISGVVAINNRSSGGLWIGLWPGLCPEKERNLNYFFLIFLENYIP